MNLSEYMRKAIIEGNLKAVKRFLWAHRGNSAAINARTASINRFMIAVPGDTALTLAIKHNQVEIIKLLVASSNIDVNKSDSEGFTPLMLAAQFQLRNIVNLLLSRKDIDLEVETPFHKQTALFMAYKYGTSEIVADLMLHGANVEHKNYKGLTAVQVAAAYNGRVPMYEPVDFSARM